MRGTNILITGGLGFIGRELARLLTSAARPVHVIDRPAVATGCGSRLVHFWPVDICDAQNLKVVIERIRPKTVYHLAAVSTIPECTAEPALAAETNIRGTANLLQALPPKTRVVFVSSGAVYAATPESKLETSPTGPVDIYGETKLKGEVHVLNSAHSGLDPIVARLFNVVGPGDSNNHLLPDIVRGIRAGDLRVGDTQSVRDFTHVLDVCRALVGLADLKTDTADGRIFNVGSGIATSTLDLVNLLRKISGTTIEPVHSEARMRPNDRSRLVAINHKLQQAIGWAPIWTVEEAAAQAWRASARNGP